MKKIILDSLFISIILIASMGLSQAKVYSLKGIFSSTGKPLPQGTEIMTSIECTRYGTEEWPKVKLNKQDHTLEYQVTIPDGKKNCTYYSEIYVQDAPPTECATSLGIPLVDGATATFSGPNC